MKKFFVVTGIVLAFIVLLIVLFLVFVTVAEYRPEDKMEAQIVQIGDPEKRSPSSLSIISWNIGYAGLDKYTDFVLDGGTMGKPRNLEAVESALNGVSDFLSDFDYDIFMLQEVDINSSRSYRIDEAKQIASGFSNYRAVFSRNYKAAIVPFPLNDPIKKVDAGIVTLNRFKSYQNIRWQMPGYYSWPVRTVHLKRCIMETRVESPVPGKDWVLINVHLTAYGDGTMRIDQLEYIKELMTRYYNEGHFVVIGGDWNSLFPGITKDQFGSYIADPENLLWLQVIPENWTPKGWTWGVDSLVPTTRLLDAPFVEGKTFTTVIDGFLVSPNVKVDMVKGYNLGFEYSDHNPVAIEVSFNN